MSRNHRIGRTSCDLRKMFDRRVQRGSMFCLRSATEKESGMMILVRDVFQAKFGQTLTPNSAKSLHLVGSQYSPDHLSPPQSIFLWSAFLSLVPLRRNLVSCHH